MRHKMRKLIISLNSYNWVKYCAGLIMCNNPEDFTIMIVKSDNSPILDFPGLCSDSVLVQRRSDLFNIGKRLGVRKLNNLMYDEIDVSKLSAQLQLQIAIGGVDEVYYQDDPTLQSILLAINKELGIEIFCYGMKDYSTAMRLDDIKYQEKLALTELIVAAGKNDDISGFEQIEYFKRMV